MPTGPKMTVLGCPPVGRSSSSPVSRSDRAAADVWIISLGGSLIAPGEVDTRFVAQFCAMVREQVDAHPNRRFVVVCGGGDPARRYQAAYRSVAAHPTDAAEDWVGIAATRLNAELIKQSFGELAPQEVVTDPTAVTGTEAPVLVAAGWKPGFSHDYDATIIAERLTAKHLVKLSSVGRIHSADPRTDPHAETYDHLSWSALQRLTGDRWSPGHHAPFDPIATAHCAARGITLVVAGRDLANLRRIIDGEPFAGTTVGPEYSAPKPGRIATELRQNGIAGIDRRRR